MIEVILFLFSALCFSLDRVRLEIIPLLKRKRYNQVNEMSNW